MAVNSLFLSDSCVSSFFTNIENKSHANKENAAFTMLTDFQAVGYYRKKKFKIKNFIS